MSGRPAPETTAAREWPPFLNLDLACRDRDPETWYPHEGEDPGPAIKICRSCVATVQCLSWALETHQDFGVWGAKTVKERHYIRRTQHQPEETA